MRSVLDLNDQFDLHRDVARKVAGAKGRAGMEAAIAQHFNHQIGEAVKDLFVLREIVGGTDKTESLDQVVDLIQIAQILLHGAEQNLADDAGSLVAVLNGELLTQMAGLERIAGPLVFRTVTTDEQQIAVLVENHIAAALLGHRKDFLFGIHPFRRSFLTREYAR